MEIVTLLPDRLTIFSQLENLGREAGLEPHFTHVEHRVCDRCHQIADADQFCGRHAAVARGLADHLPHLEPTARKRKRADCNRRPPPSPEMEASAPTDRR